MYCRRVLFGEGVQSTCECMRGCGKYIPDFAKQPGCKVVETAVVAFDAFRGIYPTSKVIKSVPVVNITRQTAQQFDFQQPYASSMLPFASIKANEHATRQVHGLKWESGDIPYDRVYPLLKEKTDSVKYLFTKGVDNAKWLTRMLKRPVLNIETFLTQYEARTGLKFMADITDRVVRKCCSDHSGLQTKP